MCGIVIETGTAASPVDESLLCRRRDVLAHRGPDDASHTVVDGWAGLAFRRLAIIDVAGSTQPLRSEDGNVVCVFNGEIYNFVELRSRLVALGHQFATAGDGEVIVHGYEQWGAEILSMLEGMFAIALVDRLRDRVLLARDRFGIKPLFYRFDAGRLVAASELKAILLGHAPVASANALGLGALRMHVPWPATAFAGIYRIPPGCSLELSRGGVPRLARFASMTYPASMPATDPEEAFEMLRRAVSRQMVADVPVGAFLSGGIDSSLIVALMRATTNGEIHTFSIKTLDQDESGDAATTARALGTTHHTVLLEQITFEDLAALPALYDEPFAETSALGVRLLSRFARERVKVALSGDGGDEVFGGYGSYRWIRASRALRIGGRQHVGAFAHRALSARAWSPWARRALRAALLFGDDPATAQRDVTSLAWAAQVDERRASETLSARIQRVAASDMCPTDAVRAAMRADRLERLPNAMLSKVDIASMSESLEVRVPMLDDALVRYADHLPTRALLGLGAGKLPLRRALARLQGKELAWAPKRGFALPLERWMRHAKTAARFDELFSGASSTLRELVGTDVGAEWRAFQTGTSRYSAGTAAMQLLWFANVALWAERFGVTSASLEPIEALPIA